MATQSAGTSEDTKTIITVLLLLFVTPIGIIVMWFWPKWKLWVKLLISIPTVLFSLFIAGVFFAAVLVSINTQRQFQRAECAALCEKDPNQEACINSCMLENEEAPVDVEESLEEGYNTQ